MLFFGFIDTANPFTSITFGDTAPGVDFFGFDDMTIGTVAGNQGSRIKDWQWLAWLTAVQTLDVIQSSVTETAGEPLISRRLLKDARCANSV
jgi:hypothetical protein